VQYVQRLAEEKSKRASSLVAEAGAAILGADTAVVLKSEILGKPTDRHGAESMLHRLSGRAHQVLTGVSIRIRNEHLREVESTTVWFGEMSEEEIVWYAATGEGDDKAGAYAIQGLAARFVLRIEGSYSNVVGLPIATVHNLLKRCGQIS
jgi:septum formation protein